MHNIEIELTTRCSCACYNCNRSIRQAPSDEYISINQIEKFVSESIEAHWRWKHINLVGGEPTLHPYFLEILSILKRYKDFYPQCRIGLLTNGYGKKVKNVLSNIPSWVHIVNSHKESNFNKFCSYNMAPIDLDNFKDKKFSDGCRILHYCGLGLTRYGYYACGPGASVDRIFGFNIGIKKINFVDEKKLRDQLNILCRYCGHFKEKYFVDKTSEEIISDTWRKAYKEYKINKPILNLY